jgi:hypothetical protein
MTTAALKMGSALPGSGICIGLGIRIIASGPPKILWCLSALLFSDLASSKVSLENPLGVLPRRPVVLFAGTSFPIDETQDQEGGDERGAKSR